MVRKLPDDPVKRRLQFLKRIYQHLEHFRALMESGEMDLPGIVTTPEGEEVYLADLLVGLDDLPPRQRQAFELICLRGYTETAATKIMLPHSKWSTPVQQYADTALARMVAAYDLKQAGPWAILQQSEDKAKRPRKRRRKTVAKEDKVPDPDDDHEDVVSRYLKAARDELLDERLAIDQKIAHIDELIKNELAQAS